MNLNLWLGARRDIEQRRESFAVARCLGRSFTLRCH
jgi:hypothetical protein